MTVFMIVAAVIAVVVFAVRGLGREAPVRVRRHGPHRLVWRYLTGLPWHGRAISDRGWLRPASDKPLTRTGHVPRFHCLPRWKQTVRRTSPVLAAVVIAAGLAADRRVTLLAFGAAAAAGLRSGFAVWRLDMSLRTREPHRTSCPTAAHGPRQQSRRSGRRQTWLHQDVPGPRHNRHQAPAGIPRRTEGARADQPYRGEQAVPHRPEREWHLKGPRPYLLVEKTVPPVPPPAMVTLDMIIEAIHKASPAELITGIGIAQEIIRLLLETDSPHIGLCIPSGDGKSVFAQLIAGQLLYKGGICLIIDHKLFSHPWALKGMPNVVSAGTEEEIHLALLWLAQEIRDRKQAARDSSTCAAGSTPTSAPGCWSSARNSTTPSASSSSTGIASAA